MSEACKLSIILFVDTDLCSKTAWKNKRVVNSKLDTEFWIMLP